MKKKIYQVDAFTDRAFGGNPAGVLIDSSGLDKNHMLKIAREMALSETAFIKRSQTPEYDYEVKFFTPTEEIDLCGHATIATFYLLAKKGYIDNKTDIVMVKQKTLAGILPVEIYFNNKEISKIMMTQARPKQIFKIEDFENIANIMGLSEKDIGLKEEEIMPMAYSTGIPDIMLPVKSIEILEKMKPDFHRLANYSKDKEVTGVHAFTLKDKEKNIISCRNFAPACGINEEAATGTSNGAMAAYLIENGIIKCDKNINIVSEQGYFMDRPSEIFIDAYRNDEGLLIKVGGKAKIVLDGYIYVE